MSAQINKDMEQDARIILEKKGFSNIHRPDDGIGDWVADRNGETFTIEVKAINSLNATTLRKGIHIGRGKKRGRLRRQQLRMMNKGKSLYLVYFRKNKRWIFKEGRSTKIKINDKSII